VSAGEATFTRAERARDLAGRVLGAAAVALFFAPWLDGGLHYVSFGAVLDWNGVSGWGLLRNAVESVTKTGLTLPIQAGSSGARAHAVDAELVCVLWASYLVVAAALVFHPRRRSHAQLVLAAALETVFATLCLVQAVSGAVTDADWLSGASLATFTTYLPATVFVVLLLALAWWPQRAHDVGIFLAGSALFTGPFALGSFIVVLHWGAVVSFLAASAGLFIASLDLGARARDEGLA
jgi:hypothetical protein